VKLIGNKNNRGLYKYLLEDLIPNDILIYVEPFGGEFGLYELITKKQQPIISIYNDIDTELYNNVKKCFKSNIRFFNEDYKNIITQFDSKDTFFFVDPPYYQKFYYKYNFETDEKHIELANILKNIKGRFLLSYQDRDFITSLYKDFNIYKYRGKNINSKPEIAIKNYEIHS
jgi:site-specific DNA-adenine methylase